jgi:hypothetical protein
MGIAQDPIRDRHQPIPDHSCEVGKCFLIPGFRQGDEYSLHLADPSSSARSGRYTPYEYRQRKTVRSSFDVDDAGGDPMTCPIADFIGDYRAFTALQRDRLATRGIDIAPYELSPHTDCRF